MQEVSSSEARVEAAEKAVSKPKNWLASEAGTQFVYAVFGAAMIALVLSFLQFSTRAVCCGDFDGYYHIRWSALLWENFSQGKWLPAFNALPLTVLSPESYADHHFLFHLLQIPFLWFFEPIMAAKIGAVFFGTAAIFSCYLLVVRYKVEHPVIWLLALLTCANPFFYRMNMAKAPPLSIVFTVLGAFLLFQRKYIWLLPLTFIFVWAYSLYPMLIVAAVIWAAIVFWNEDKFELRPIIYTTVGAIAGNIINPYFPQNIYLFVEHAATKLKVGGDYSVPVGGEWYPYDSKMLLGLCAVALLAMFVGYILYTPSEKRLEEKSTFFLLFATFLMVWTFQSKRFAEYFPPMAVLFAAFAFQAFANRTRIQEATSNSFGANPAASKKDDDFWKNACVGLVSVLLFAYMFVMFRGVEVPKAWLSEAQAAKRCLNENPFTEQNRCVIVKGLSQELQQNDPPERFAAAMNWAAANIPEFDERGERVRIFNTDWDDFPKMFFHDTKHAYIAGLDPNYLFSRNQDLWKFYEEITTGKTENPAPIIVEKFGARYIFTDRNHHDLMNKLNAKDSVEKIYPTQEIEAEARENCKLEGRDEDRCEELSGLIFRIRDVRETDDESENANDDQAAN